MISYAGLRAEVAALVLSLTVSGIGEVWSLVQSLEGKGCKYVRGGYSTTPLLSFRYNLKVRVEEQVGRKGRSISRAECTQRGGCKM